MAGSTQRGRFAIIILTIYILLLSLLILLFFWRCVISVDNVSVTLNSESTSITQVRLTTTEVNQSHICTYIHVLCTYTYTFIYMYIHTHS